MSRTAFLRSGFESGCRSGRRRGAGADVGRGACTGFSADENERKHSTSYCRSSVPRENHEGKKEENERAINGGKEKNTPSPVRMPSSSTSHKRARRPRYFLLRHEGRPQTDHPKAQPIPNAATIILLLVTQYQVLLGFPHFFTPRLPAARGRGLRPPCRWDGQWSRASCRRGTCLLPAPRGVPLLLRPSPASSATRRGNKTMVVVGRYNAQKKKEEKVSCEETRLPAWCAARV